MKKYFKYIGIFLFFLIVFYLVPISGDDWGNYLVGSNGLRHSLGVALGMYFDWEGRLVSRIFINILTYHKWAWNILNALLVAATIYMGERFVSKKAKPISFLLLILVFFLINPYTFSQTMTWVAGNITYFFIVPVLLFYFFYLINHDKYNKFLLIVFLFINLFGTMFVENMALVLICGNILLIVYKYIKTKKIDKRLIVYTVISIGSFLAMFLSPGTRYRNSIENLDFNRLNIFEKVIYNIPNFVYYTFIVNPYLLVLMSISNYLIIRDKVQNKWMKYGLIVLMLVVPLLVSMVYPLSLVRESSLNFIIGDNLFVVCYFIVYLIASFILLFIQDKNDLVGVFLFLIGIVSNLVMLISPTWGFRTSLFTYLALAIVAIRVIDSYIKEGKFNKFLEAGISIVLICCLGVYLTFYINVSRCSKANDKMIKEQLESDKEVIYVDRFPEFANCNINPDNHYHIEKYKLYYDIPKDKELVLVDGKWKKLIFYVG